MPIELLLGQKNSAISGRTAKTNWIIAKNCYTINKMESWRNE